MPRHGPGLGAGSFPSANKLLARYEIDRARKIHQQKINSMKHRLDVGEPKRYNHLILRLKQIQKEEERQAEIDHENKLLLSKMTHVMKYGGNIDNWNNYESRSLNYPLREKQSEDIARENLGIARRLETVKPQLQISAWERDYQKHAYLKRLWSDSSKDFDDYTPRRYRSRMSKARSLENSLDEDDEYDSIAPSEEKRLPRLDKARKFQMRSTQSESNAPVSSRRDEARDKPSTKLPKIVPHKALIEHDYSMYYGSVSSLNKLPLDSERSVRLRRLELQEDDSSLEDSPYQARQRDTARDKPEPARDRPEPRDKPEQRDKPEHRDKPDKKPDPDKDKNRKNKAPDKSSNRSRKQTDRGLDEKSNDKASDENDTQENENAENLHSKSQTSFQSAVLPENDLERVQTLISEEKDKDLDNKTSEPAQKTDKDVAPLTECDENVTSDRNDDRKRVDSKSINETKDDGQRDQSKDNTEAQGNAGESQNEKDNDGGSDQKQIRKENNQKKNKHQVNDNSDKTIHEKNEVTTKKSHKHSHNKSVAENESASKRTEDYKDGGNEAEDTTRGKDTGKENDGLSKKAILERKKKQKADGTSGGPSGGHSGGAQTQKDDDGSDVAMLFKIAKQLGKPEEIFIRTLIKKTHKQRMKTKTKFREKYDLDLIKELKNGLGQEWYRLIDSLLQERGDADCYALFDALSPGETVKTADLCDVVQLLCSRDNAAIADLKESYRKEFSVSLEEDIMDRTNPPVQILLLTLQKGSRDETTSVDIDAVRKDALDLHESGEGRWDSESGVFLKLLNSRSFAHMQAMFGEYKSVSEGQSILAAMKADCPRDYSQVLSTLVHCVGSPAGYYAEQIHKHKLPTDQVLIDILVTRSEVDMPAIRKVYKRNYGIDVIDDIKSKPHPTMKCLIELANRMPAGGKGDKAKGTKSVQEPQQSHAKKPPAGKKADSVKGKADASTDNKAGGGGKSDHGAKHKAQESKSKQDNPETGGHVHGRKREDAEPARKKKATPAKEKEDGDHNGTVRPAPGFRPEDDCEKLNSAMSGLGTDEEVIIAIIPRRSNRQRQKLKQSYEQKFKKNLMIDLESELSGDTEEIILALMMTPPEYDAYILHEAVEGLGTSEATLVGILGSRSAEEMKGIREHYKKAYKTDLEMDITRDAAGSLKELLTRLVRGERQAEVPVNAGQAKKDAQDLYQEGNAPLDPSSTVFQDLLVCKNQYQVKATFEEYKKLAGHDFCTGLTKANLGDDEEVYVSIAKAVEDPVAFHADKLHSCFTVMGTNDNMLIRIAVSRAEIDTRDIKSRYMELYSQNLLDVINRECRGDYKALLQAILDDNQTKAKKGQKDDKAGEKTGSTVRPVKPFNPMEDSVRLHGAMQGFGADLDVIVDILPTRTNDQRQEIQAKFQDKYNKNLVSELRSELRGDFEEVVLGLMMRPLEYDAHCLHEAVDGLGTSEGILIGILSTRTGEELATIKEQYKKTYGTDLQNDITSDVSGDFEEMLVEILKCQREQKQTVDQQLAKDDAKKLYKDGQISIDPKDDTFKAILARRSRAQVRATFEEYKKLTGNDVYVGIEKAFIGDTERGYKGLAQAVGDPVQFFSERLMECFEGIGTNDTRLIRIIISRSEIDLQDIKSRFHSIYKKTVGDCVKSECSGDYKRILLAILGDLPAK